MINYCPNFKKEEVKFQKISATKSSLTYDESKVFYIMGNDVSVTPEQQSEIFEYAKIKNEKLGGLSKTEKEKHEAAKKLVTMLTIIANYSPTLVAPTQLRALFKMQTKTEISAKKLNEAVDGLLEMGLIEKCCLQYEGTEQPSVVLLKLSKAGIALVEKHCRKALTVEKDRALPNFNVDALPTAWKASENFQICQLVTEMFKNQFTESVYFESKYSLETEKPKITTFVTVKSDGKFDKKIYLFAPRSQPDWQDYLESALKEFNARFEEANEMPKLLLSCEDAEHLYRVHHIVEDLDLAVDVIYTEDIAPMTKFKTAFSWFNGEGVEIQLESKC